MSAFRLPTVSKTRNSTDSDEQVDRNWSSFVTCVFSRGRILSIASVIAVLVSWQLGSQHVSALILPPPTAVLGKFVDPAWLNSLLVALGHSLIQLALGFGLTLVIALPLGILMGRSRILRHMFEPVIGAFYAIPPVAFVPFIVIWFGLFLEARVALVFWMSFFDVLVIMIAGSRDLRPELLKVGRSFGVSSRQQLRFIMLPALLPFVIAALRVGSARAINGMITAELFLAAVNLGALLKQSSQQFDTVAVLSIVLLICFFGLLAQSVIALVERHFLHWHVRS